MVSQEPRFFVVRRFHDRLHGSIEFADFSGKYTKEDRKQIVYRVEIPARLYGWSLDKLMGEYRRGMRLKQKAPVKLEPRKERNGRKVRLPLPKPRKITGLQKSMLPWRDK